MLDVVKLSQFFVPSQDVDVDSLSPSERANIRAIWGESQSGGALDVWRPSDPSPSLATLVANRAYLMRSVLPFSPHSVGIEVGGLHPYSSSVEKVYQMLTYRGASSFDLDGLSAGVRSKIKVILAEGYTESGSIRQWGPNNALNTLKSLVPGSTYLIESVGEGFAPYDLGLPAAAESSSSSETPEGSSSSSPPCGQVFNTSLTSVLGANPDFPEFYYGEAIGMLLTTASVATLQYDDLTTSGLPLTVDIEIGGQIIGNITAGLNYIGKPFSFTYDGNTYCGTFKDAPNGPPIIF
jgi:hypothetical protein